MQTHQHHLEEAKRNLEYPLEALRKQRREVSYGNVRQRRWGSNAVRWVTEMSARGPEEATATEVAALGESGYGFIH